MELNHYNYLAYIWALFAGCACTGGGGVGDSVCWSWGVSNFHQTFMKRESNIINLPSQTLSC